MIMKLVSDRSGKTYLVPEHLAESFYQIRDSGNPNKEFGKWEVVSNGTINLLWMIFPDWDDPKVSQFNYRWVDIDGQVIYANVEPKVSDRGWMPRNTSYEIVGNIGPLQTWYNTLESRYRGFKLGQEVVMVHSYAPMECEVVTIIEKTSVSIIALGKGNWKYTSDQYGFINGQRRIYTQSEFAKNFGNINNFIA